MNYVVEWKFINKESLGKTLKCKMIKFASISSLLWYDLESCFLGALHGTFVEISPKIVIHHGIVRYRPDVFSICKEFM